MLPLLPLLLLASLSGTARAQSISNAVTMDYAYAASAHTTSGQANCGGIPNTGRLASVGWTVHVDQWWDHSGQANAGRDVATTLPPTPFASGAVTAPRAGTYYISAFARCENNACDCTVRVGGTRVAGFGTDRVERWEDQVGQFNNAYWSSHGVALFRRLTAGQAVNIFMESGASNDCLRDTSYFYGQLNMFLYLPE